MGSMGYDDGVPRRSAASRRRKDVGFDIRAPFFKSCDQLRSMQNIQNLVVSLQDFAASEPWNYRDDLHSHLRRIVRQRPTNCFKSLSYSFELLEINLFEHDSHNRKKSLQPVGIFGPARKKIAKFSAQRTIGSSIGGKSILGVTVKKTLISILQQYGSSKGLWQESPLKSCRLMISR